MTRTDFWVAGFAVLGAVAGILAAGLCSGWCWCTRSPSCRR